MAAALSRAARASSVESFAGNGQRRAFTPAVILFIALPAAKDNIDPGYAPWDSCRGDVPFAKTIRSSVMDCGSRQVHDDRHERIWVRVEFSP
jgi:hypothetical protein